MALVFDVSSDMAMFRKPYTTTSQVSFAFPPPTAIAGLIAAIVGINHDASSEASRAAFWDRLKGTRVGIGMLCPVRWFSTTINLLRFKTVNGDMNEHIQSKHQILKQPQYRIYVKGGELYSSLKNRLEKEEFKYTPFLGTAYALADIKHIGEFDDEPVYDQETWVDSILPLYNGVQLDVLKSRGLHKERVPFEMSSQRILLHTVSIIYPEMNKNRYTNPADESHRIWLKKRGELHITQVGEEKVSWFEPWGNL